MPSRIAVLTTNMYGRGLNNPKLCVCSQCKEKLTPPTTLSPYEIFIKKMGNTTKWYHVECARSINLI